MSARTVYVEGIGLWAPRLPGWQAARSILRSESPPAAAHARPSPQVLGPTERRRAPDSVAVALEVAAGACAVAERDPRALPSVFASSYGDLAIMDYLCEVLARAPLDTSPTRFHNSVHNAAAGYWAIATGCTEPYTAITSGEHTFGTGLLTAAVHATAERTPVLYVAYDIEARGPLATVVASRGMLGVALVLTPESTARSIAHLEWRLTNSDAPPTGARPENAALVAGNALSESLTLFEALADGVERAIVHTAGPRSRLELRVEPAVAP
jgi:hypothetical protein